MAQLRFSKKGTIVLVVALLLISFGIGYTVWKVTGAPNLAPTDSSAGGEGGGESCTRAEEISCKNACGSGSSNYCTYGNRECLVLCNSSKRCQRCDGSWYIASECKKEDCDDDPKACSCASFAGCGVNCWFPSGTQKDVDKAVSGTCGRKMAFCIVSGNTTKVVIRDPGNCWSQRNVCKNPTAEETCAPKCGDGTIDAGEQCDPPGSVSSACTEGDGICKSDCTCPVEVIENTCEGGGIVSQTDEYTVGDTVTVVGWAYDTDGIDSIVPVAVDGLFDGNATVTSGCPTVSSACDETLSNVVTWTYSFTSTAITHVVSIEWKDTKGLTGASCNATQTVATQQINPNWEMIKTASGVCNDVNPDNVFLPYEYTVTVTNTSAVSGEITKIVDTLDTGVSESWIDLDSINPAATVSGNVITWNLTGDLASFAAGQSKVFTYTVNFPEESFDAINAYTNIVIATPTVGDPFSANESVIVSCNIPDTGVFDTTKGRLITGVLLILASIMYVYFDGSNYAVSNTLMGVGKLFGYDSKVDRARRRFERKL